MLAAFSIIAVLYIGTLCNIISDNDAYEIIKAILIFTLFFKFVC